MVRAVNPLVIAALLAALAVAPRPSRCTVSSLQPPARADLPERTSGPAAARSAPPRADRELVVFGLLNLALVALDGGLARASSQLLDERPELTIALIVSEAGRIGAVVFLLHFILQYARASRPAAVLAALYGIGGVLEIAGALGALGQLRDARPEVAWILGAPVLSVRTPPTLLGSAFAVATVAAAIFALASLGRAFLQGRREAAGFIGPLPALGGRHSRRRPQRRLGARPAHRALFGYAAFVNGVIMTLLARFTDLRGQLEARAGELKDRARALARSYEELRAGAG